jgi:peptide/nickel transport system substrate-binding protein
MAAFRGERRPMMSTLSPNTPEFWPEATQYIRFDQAEARRILAEAGYRDTDRDGIVEQAGRPLAIDLFIFGNRDNNPSVIVAESIQADLRAVGIDVRINVRPWDDQSVVAMNEQHHMINFDMPLPNASVLTVMFHSRETPRPGRYGMAFTHVAKGAPEVSAELDRLLDAGDNAPSFEARRNYFQQAQRIIGENYLGVPITQGFVTYAMVRELRGVQFNNGGHAMFNAAYFERRQ